MDPDDPRVEHDIGHAGVPIYSIEDMETVFRDLPIERCSTYLADRVCGLLTPAYFPWHNGEAYLLIRSEGQRPTTC